ncbi:MAG: ABC transporter substrate-binding protein [Pseudomonadota bacterium]
MKKLCLIVGFLLLPAAVWAGTPTEALKRPVQEGIDLLRDPAYADASKKVEQRDHMWAIIREAFDFRLISASALGRNWKRFSPEEQSEFTSVFSQLLGRTYISKIQGQYSDEQVAFIGEELVSEQKAVVQTEIVRKDTRIPVDYYMRQKNGEWRVYDVKVEGVGLVLNYRRQFNTFMASDETKPEALIQKLKDKLEKNEPIE